jgi:hypothetical protein
VEAVSPAAKVSTPPQDTSDMIPLPSDMHTVNAKASIKIAIERAVIFFVIYTA